MNLCEIGLFHIVWGVAQGTPVITIMRFGENNVLCPKYIDKHIWILGGMEGDIHGPPYIFCLLFKKTEKVEEYLY